MGSNCLEDIDEILKSVEVFFLKCLFLYFIRKSWNFLLANVE